MPEIILFSGSHGAGKDSVEKAVRKKRGDVRRIVRHISREPADGERRGEDYHFISRNEFRELIASHYFIEWAEYPDVLSGTAFDEIVSDPSAEDEYSFASLTLNLEDALLLRKTLHEAGHTTTTLFISPVSQDSFFLDSTDYLRILRERIEKRNRAFEYINNKIAKAALYREMFLEHQDIHYIPNINNQINSAVEHVSSILDFRQNS